MFNEFMYANLKYVSDFGNGTSLCIYEPTHKLYIVKNVDLSYKDYYEKIAKINNPHLAKILYINYSDDSISVVREYISGDSLSDMLKANKTLTEAQAIKITAQVCEGLTELHNQELVHRDVNPNNILITTDGNAIIIDYGIVRSFNQTKSADTVILGTPGYAAPEQFGFSQSDQRTDIYAVGVLLNVMLCGVLPNEKLYAGTYGSIVKKCIQIDSKQRYLNMTELCNALRNQVHPVHPADKIIKQIPGIRSKRTAIVVMSVIGYLFALMFVFTDFTTIKPNFTNYLCALIYWIFILPIPLFCFGNMGGIWDKLPFTQGASKATQRIIYYLLGTFSLFFGFIILGICNQPA